MTREFVPTAKRVAWLLQVHATGNAISACARGSISKDCMQAGWTEWVVTDDATHEHISWTEACRRYADPLVNVRFTALETLTGEGVALLQALGKLP